MNFIAKLERKFGKYSIRNLPLVLIVMYVAGYIIEYSNVGFFYYLTLDPYAILHGEVWRIVSWLLIPPPENNFFFAIIMLIFYYSISNTLERAWGTFQLNLYLLSGVVFTVLGSFLMMGYCYAFKPDYGSYKVIFRFLSYFYSTYYVNMSIFLAYAATFPDNTVLLMFIIPVKVKVLGIIYGVYIIYTMIDGMRNIYVTGLSFVYPFVIGASLLNFAIFFLTSRRYILTGFKRHAASMAYKRQKKAAETMKNITKHKCAVCGRTERDGDDISFRFCSKCEGNYEYCEEHLYTHIHFTGNQK